MKPLFHFFAPKKPTSPNKIKGEVISRSLKLGIFQVGSQKNCAAVGFGIESSNIVGYNTVTVDKEWTIFAVNFEKVTGGALTIQDAFPYQTGMTKGNSDTADQIQVQNGDGYDIYYLSDGNFKKMGKTTYYPERDGKWFKGTETTESSAPLAAGQAFWYGAKGYATPFTMNVAGMVPAEDTRNITVDKAWTHIANPYPVALPINSITFADGMTKGNSDTADQIQVQNGDGYDIYYLSDGNFKKMGKTTYYPERDGKWFKGTETTPTEGVIAVGCGAWYGRKGENEVSIVITSPIVK